MSTTYTINLADSDTKPAWLSLCTTATPGAQDSGRVRYTVTTERAAELEREMDADESVLDYDHVLPSVHLAIGAGAPSKHYPAEERERNGATDYDVTMTVNGHAIDGGITLYRDTINGGMRACGSPLDVWVSDSLVRELDKLPDQLRKATIVALEARDEGEVQS